MCEHPSNEEFFAVFSIKDSTEVLAVCRDDIHMYCICSDCQEERKRHPRMFYYTYIYNVELVKEFAVEPVERLRELPTITMKVARRFENKAMFGFKEWLSVKEEIIATAG